LADPVSNTTEKFCGGVPIVISPKYCICRKNKQTRSDGLGLLLDGCSLLPYYSHLVLKYLLAQLEHKE